jgi:glutamate racemase
LPRSDQPIGIFDSGIGGLSVAYAIFQHLPQEALLYYGDTARIPYGPKPAETIRQYSEEITSFLLEQGCKLIVVACNTASAAALNHLRHRWPEVPIVGMEPAVKPGALATRTGKVAVLATAGTFQSQRYASLMHRYAREVELLEDPCTGLVERIEAGAAGSPETEALLRRIVTPMQAAGADTFVLGCTHYPFVLPVLEKILGPQATIINPAPAVARQVQRQLAERELLRQAEAPPPQHRFYASGPREQLQALAGQLLGFEVTVSPPPSSWR